MKLVNISYHFQYNERIERILDQNDIEHFIRFPMTEGKDTEGKHYGSQVHPGNVSLVQAQVPDTSVDSLLDDLEEFKEERKAHQHLEALVLSVDRKL